MKMVRAILSATICTVCSWPKWRSKRPQARRRVEKITCVADVGKIVNKLVVDGQLYGGMAQAIGLALTEDFEDIKKHSTLVGAGFPYIKQIPDDMEIIYVESPRPDGPFGASGVGRIAADLSACSCYQRHLQCLWRTGAKSPGPAGEGAGRHAEIGSATVFQYVCQQGGGPSRPVV